MPLDRPSDAQTFGDLLRRLRRARDLTQEALAECSGVSVRAISDLERGARTHPYRETANLLAAALELAGGERAAFLAASRGPLRRVAGSVTHGRGAPLPRPLTPLIGRHAELADLVGYLRDDRARLLTLTGPAGVGKTRLAVAAAAALAEDFPDGVVYVDLAPLRDPSAVAPALASALGLPDRGAIPLMDILRRALGARQMLLLFDNFEHLLEAAPLLSELLQAGPGVRALVTSRAALRLRGEREIVLAPMPTPDPGAKLPARELAGWEVVRLFVERARDADAGFQLTDENAAAVAAICQRLDGLPLAIELAAARVKTLAPAALLVRLEQRLPLLTRGTRDAPARHQTLQAAIAWSYDLLTPSEQALLRCLAVFAGGWTLTAAELVGGRSDIPDVLDGLAALCEQSLVVRDDSGREPRYRMLETIREFALDRVESAGEGERANQAHLHYLHHLARENDQERLDAEVETRLQRLNAEDANLRAGIEWGIAHDPDLALAVVSALGYYWMLADRPAMGIELHERVLATGAGADRPERALVLQQAAWLMLYLGLFTPAEPLVAAAHALAEQLGDARTRARARMCQGSLAVSRGDFAEAKALFEEALARCESVGDDWGMNVCLTELGLASLDWGDARGAVSCFERVAAIVVKCQLPARYQAHYLVNLADAYRQLGRHETAMEACLAALALAGDTGRMTNAAARLILGLLLLERGDRGDLAQAASSIARSLGVFWEVGDRWTLAQALEGAAAVMAAGSDATAAARCFGAADALRVAMPYPVGAGQQPILARQVAEVRATLGEPDFARAWTAGQQRSLAASVADAREVLGTMGDR